MPERPARGLQRKLQTAGLVLGCLLALTATEAIGEAVDAKDSGATPEAMRFFEAEVRPVLAEHCYRCHGEEKQAGDVRLDSREAMLHGNSNSPALVPERPQRSSLLQILDKGEGDAPPHHRLSERDRTALAQWIRIGAPWPNAHPDDAAANADQPTNGSSSEASSAASESAQDEASSRYWAFRPIRRPEPPQVADSRWVRNPIDSFVLDKLEQKGLSPNPPATDRELIRRAYFDLIGLPPSPEAVDRFVNTSSPEAWPRLVDRLLDRPEYGERWGRHWLDVVRFAQTNGYERDAEKPYAWRYRDYVIDSFNEDKPYDEFIKEQLAGDELEKGTNETRIATGFYRLGVWDDEPDDLQAAKYDYLDDILSTTSQAFMGLTVGCARCHDHMFDPIGQDDYYQMLAFFRNIRYHEKPRHRLDSATLRPLAPREKIAAWEAERDQKLQRLTNKLEQIGEDQGEKREQLQERIETLRDQRPPFDDWALVVTEHGPDPKPTHLLDRGNPDSPKQEVQPEFLDALGGGRPNPATGSPNRTSGRRRALAEWIASEDNPLTARVMVNRIWQHHFGRALVPTPNDFGEAGLDPTHPKLLDWLAAEFIESGWSIKHMHRLIMDSAAYRMSSRADRERPLAEDQDNKLLWRQRMRRLEAEAIRDAVLATAGTLNGEMGGRGIFPRLSGEAVAGASRPGHGWGYSEASQRHRRSVYIFVKRTLGVPGLELFDYTNTTAPVGERSTTTVAPQALMLLNSRFMKEQSAALADRLVREAGSEPRAQIRRAYELALGRDPTERELSIALRYLDQQRRAYETLSSRLTFRPNVPLSLDKGYMNKLKPVDFVLGPRPAWSYHRGHWGGGYSGIVTTEPHRSPFALWRGERFADGEITGRLRLHNASELGGLILRGRASGGTLRAGYALLLNPRDETVTLRRYGDDETQIVAETGASFDTERWLDFRIAIDGPRVRLWLGGSESPVLDVTDDKPQIEAGRLGVRLWGAAISFDNLEVQPAGDAEALPVASYDGPLLGDQRAKLEGWDYFGGAWSVRSDGGHEVGPDPGAKAIWREPTLRDGTVEAKIMLAEPGGDAGLVLRVTDPEPGTNALRGYNVNLKTDALRLGRHDHNWEELRRVPMDLAPGEWHGVKVRLDGPRIRIYVNGADEPQIDYTDPDPPGPGRVGLRTYRARCAIRNLTVHSNGEKWHADLTATRSTDETDETGRAAAVLSEAERRALESFARVVLNLNEFVYID